MYIKKRWMITAVTYTLAALIVLGGFIFNFYNDGIKYKTTMSYPQKENILSLAESLEQIDYSLKKGSYATTPYQAVVLAANVLIETGNAKGNLQHLPVYDLALEKTAKYLSQTGEFVFSLAEKSIKGEGITQEDQESLKLLSLKASELSNELRAFSAEVSSENYDYDGLAELFVSKRKDAVAASTTSSQSVSDGNIFEKIEDAFKDFAPVYYDGKFTDKKESQPDEFWNGKEEVSEEKAKEIAAFVMNVSKESVKTEKDTEQNGFTCYRFTAMNGDKEAVIIKKGGYIYSYNSNCEIGDSDMSREEAIGAAEEFLKKAGFENMVPCSSAYNGNILTVKFVSTKDGILIYPESVSVGVALDKGNIVSFVGNDFWNNLKLKRVFTADISQDTAAKTVSQRLTIKEANKVFMLSEGEREYPCYEFITESEDGNEVRIYINSKTGTEENIILVNETENGTYFN